MDAGVQVINIKKGKKVSILQRFGGPTVEDPCCREVDMLPFQIQTQPLPTLE